MIPGKIKITLLLIVAGLMPACFFAQTIVTDGEMDKKYTPVENPLFIKHNTKNGGARVNEITFTNAIKYYPTALFRQKVFFTYERKIADGFSLSGGIGKAFGSDYFQNFLTSEGYYSSPRDHLAPYNLISNSVYIDSRALFFVGAKLYFSSNAFDEGYTEFTYRNETTHYYLNEHVNGYPVQGDRDASFRMHAFSFGWGYLSTSGRNNNIVHELFLNIGFKVFNYTRFNKEESTGTNYVYVRNDFEEAKYRLVPTVNIGYAFGLGF